MNKNNYSVAADALAPLAPLPHQPQAKASLGWAAWRFLFLLCMLGLGLATTAQASHFRYGSLTYQTVPTDATKRTVQFKLSMSFRRSYFGNVTLGSTISDGIVFNYGDGTTTNVQLLVTSVDVVNDIIYGEFSPTHKYTATQAYTANATSCCRIGTLANNANDTWLLRVVVNAGTGNNSPVSTLPPVVNLATGQAAATFQLAANDPDGDALTYSLATAADVGVSDFVNATGLTVNATTGAVAVNTVGRAVGQLSNAVIKVSDGKTSILVDFIIKTTKVSTPPQFDYSVTPPTGYVYQVAPGTPVRFQVRATDSDAGDIVNLQGIGLPPGAAMSPALPATGNPVASSFSWTPTLNNLGTSVISFVAQDAVGVQTTTSVTIQVSTKPTFDVPPTPSNHSVVQVTPGTLISQVVQASSVDPNSPVRLLSAIGLPASATYSPALPTAAANPTSTTLTWRPVLADWGSHVVTFTAANSYNDQNTHALEYIVNSAPSFTSTPTTLSVVAGQPFHYSITTTDPDLPYGDELEIEHPSLPAWLTLTDNGDGTASLDGTPTVANAGTNSVTLIAADLYHHGASYGLITQAFDITVIPCTVQAVSQNLTVALGAQGQVSITGAQVNNGSVASCGIATLQVSPSTFDCAKLGTNTVTLTVTDGNGYTSTATATVTVLDNTLPTLTAPAAVAVSTDAGQCTASSVALGTATATDNCSATVKNDAPATFPIGTTTVTYTATDASGNVATATQVVTVRDTEQPVLSVPVAKTISTDRGQCSASGVALGTPTAGDNCGSVMLTNDAPAVFPKGITTVTYTATDAAGNKTTATQLVTVTDTEQPVLAVPANLTVSAPASLCGAIVTFNATATDNCAATVVTSPASGSTFPVGSTTVRVTATDAAGNSSSGTFTVTVNDVTAPTVATRNVSVSLVNGSASVTPTQVNNNSSDACGIASVVLSRTSFDCATLGANNVTLTVTDIHGNVASAPAVVTVIGSVPTPTVVATPASVYVGATPTIYLGYGSQTVTLTASGGVSYRWNAAAGLSTTTGASTVFTPTVEGTYSFTVTATSASGCSAATTIKVYVEDVRCGNGNDKVQICHNGQTICVAASALNTHLSHGDNIGTCTKPAATALSATTNARNAASASEAPTLANELAAYPNPVVDKATVTFRTAVDGPAQVVVYNELGQHVATLYEGSAIAGNLYTLQLSSTHLASGLYVCRLITGGKTQLLRLTIAR
jgi:hypothetical protein